MNINHIKSKIHFGKYKGRTFEEIVIKDPIYISWCLINLDNFLLSLDFIKDAVMTNRDFFISDSAINNLHLKMNMTNKIIENQYIRSLDSLEEKYEFDYNYKNWLNLEFRDNLIIEEITNREKLRLEIRKKSEEQEELREKSQREFENEQLSNEIDWTIYNEDLGWGEQSEDFWNQF